jgi:hypothetical protein
MNRKAYGILLAVIFLALSFLMGCGGSSSTTTTGPPPPPPPSTSNFVLYLSGQDALTADTINYYALAGVVTISSTGTVTAGEQDYNDADGVTSPSGGDKITGGTLTVSSTTGQGTLTLITNNSAVGAAGTETLGVQFVNANHALIIQFDGSATSSGSLDLQSLSPAPTGGFAFAIAGEDPNANSIAIGGVFNYASTTPGSPNGTVDVNEGGSVQTDRSLTISFNAPDASGRGTITSSAAYGAAPIAFIYYIVGPEAVRIIDVDTADSAVGSAFGQGSGSFTNASLPASVLALSNGFNGPDNFGAVGQFTTNSTPVPATFTGVGEDNELDENYLSPLASPFSGTYTMSSVTNGYGSMTIAGGLGGGAVSLLGLYLTDPGLNISDPNNTSGGGGGLLIDLDDSHSGGLGVVIPQTDTTATDFNGNYAVGWQDFNYFANCNDCEFDMVAQGTMASGGALSLTGLVSDPFESLTAGATTVTGATFTGTPLPDPNPANQGRFSMLSSNTTPNPLAAVIGTSPNTSFDVVIYQASAGQLFWLNVDTSKQDVFVGPLEQQSASLTGIPGAVELAAKTQMKKK